MKNCILISIILLVTACSSKTILEKNCNENLEFKQAFFSRIDTVDLYFTKSERKPIRPALLFLSKYAPVSFSSMLNYANAYSYGAYLTDRKGWIEWYEKSKCSNIQIRKELDTSYVR
jgi:hypothetical protein